MCRLSGVPPVVMVMHVSALSGARPPGCNVANDPIPVSDDATAQWAYVSTAPDKHCLWCYAL